MAAPSRDGRAGAALVLALAGALVGCAEVRMGETPGNRREIAPGAGLLTGPAGAWRIGTPPRPGAAETAE